MRTILSIQSSVAMGAVGNTMAAAVMAASRHHLCRVDTVQLTAHPGHGFRAGGSVGGKDFAAILEGVDRLGAWRGIDAMMTGYIADEGQIPAIASAMDSFAGSGGGKPLLVDPAFGDHGRLYLGEDIARGVRDTLLPKAGIISPNAFELGWLTDATIAGPGDAEAAAAGLLEKHPRLEAVITTGIVHDGSVSDSLLSRDGSSLFGKAHSSRREFPGAGDMFAALVMKALMDGTGLTDSVAEAHTRTTDILGRTEAMNEKEISLEAVRQALGEAPD